MRICYDARTSRSQSGPETESRTGASLESCGGPRCSPEPGLEMGSSEGCERRLAAVAEPPLPRQRGCGLDPRVLSKITEAWGLRRGIRCYGRWNSCWPRRGARARGRVVRIRSSPGSWLARAPVHLPAPTGGHLTGVGLGGEGA